MFQLEVAPGVTFMEGEWRGRFPSGNVLVLEGSRTRAIVDTGAGEEVLSAVAARGRVDVVINTHYHIDHVRGNGRFLGEGGADFWCPAGEAGALASWEEFLKYTGFDVFGASEALEFRQVLGWAATPVARELADGDVLDFGGLEAVVLRLPGHTPGHSGLWFPSLQVVFSADIDLSRFGPWYGDVHADIDEYLDSLHRLGRLVEEASAGGRRRLTILTSHRRPLDDEGFRRYVPAFEAKFAEREQRILALLAAGGPQTTLDLARQWPVYGPGTLARSLPGFLKAEYFMVKHHMDRLARAGQVRLAQPDGAPSATTDSDHVGGNQLWQAL